MWESRASWCAAVLSWLVLSCGGPDGDGQTNDAVSVPCLPTEQPCGSACVDVSVSSQHCGACGFACAPGAACQGGVCVAPTGQTCSGGACTPCPGTVCTAPAGEVCVSLTDDRAHCGMCNNPCAASDRCVDGQCVLDCGALTACNGACVDVQADALHCGACGSPCADDTICMQGACACPTGLTACGDACVDTTLDPAHCGGCGQACAEGELCEGGCVGPDGCTDIEVSGLEVTAIDVYQAVQVAIMNEGAPIASAARNADVVAGRRALFRVHVAPEAGWSPREVSARLELSSGPDSRELFFSMLTPTKASSDADPSTTLQIDVPAEAITASTSYAVTLVECAATAMASGSARFPSEAYEPLEARETGPIKVHIIPIGSPGPDVSDEGLKVFKERLAAVFPVTEVIFTVGPPLSSAASSMCSALGSISSRRSQDGAALDVYYYGLTEGILGGQSGCSNANSSASSPKVSVGWAQGFGRDSAEGAATMCHELGHSHGRLHAPCNVQDPDPRYPYSNAEIGVWGYDFRVDKFYEPTRKDMMSYCPEPRWNAWISDYNYQALVERVIAVNALAETPLLASASVSSWRLLVSDSAGLHWVEEPLLVRGVPEGTPARAVIHGSSGPIREVTAYKQELHDGVGHDAFMLVLPMPEASWRAIEVPGLLAPYALD